VKLVDGWGWGWGVDGRREESTEESRGVWSFVCAYDLLARRAARFPILPCCYAMPCHAMPCYEVNEQITRGPKPRAYVRRRLSCPTQHAAAYLLACTAVHFGSPCVWWDWDSGPRGRDVCTDGTGLCYGVGWDGMGLHMLCMRGASARATGRRKGRGGEGEEEEEEEEVVVLVGGWIRGCIQRIGGVVFMRCDVCANLVLGLGELSMLQLAGSAPGMGVGTVCGLRSVGVHVCTYIPDQSRGLQLERLLWEYILGRYSHAYIRTVEHPMSLENDHNGVYTLCFGEEKIDSGRSIWLADGRCCPRGWNGRPRRRRRDNDRDSR